MAVQQRHERRTFLSRFGTGATAAGLTMFAGQSARAQSEGAAWRPRRHPEDDWLDRISGVHRFVIDTTTPGGFSAALTFAANYYTASQNGYGLKNNDLAVVIVARHDSTPFAYADAMWTKYGTSLVERSGFADPATKQPPTANLYRARVEALIGRGAHLAVCQMATRRLADVIARASGTNADVVYNELVANLMSNAHLVPAGIVIVDHAQERGYSLANAV
jgi:intracellular sulfur oxidation DsrE/DsrF family protein